MSSLAVASTASGRALRVPALLSVAAAIGGLAAVSPLLAVAACLVICFVVASLTRPVVGLALVVALTFLESLVEERGGGGALKLAGVILVVSWAVHAKLGKSSMPLLLKERPFVSFAALGLVGWAFASRLWATDTAVATSSTLRLALAVLLLVIVYAFVTEARHVRWVLIAYLVGVCLSVLVGLQQGPREGPNVFVQESRLIGAIGDPNELAAVLLPALGVSGFWLLAARGWPARVGLAALSAGLLVSIFLTESRGGLVGLGVLLVVGLAVAGPFRARIAAGLLVALGLAVAYYAFAATPAQVDRVAGFSSAGGTGRTDIWTIAVSAFSDHPYFGVGIGNFPVVEFSYLSDTLNLTEIEIVAGGAALVVHNTYLEILTELGPLGVAFFVSLLVAAAASGWRAIRALTARGEHELATLSRGLVAGLIAMLFAFVFISGEFEKQLWLILGLLLALAAIARRMQESGLPLSRSTGFGRVRAVPAYDASVNERRRFGGDFALTTQMDSLLQEQRRLDRRRAAFAAKEERMRIRSLELERAERRQAELGDRLLAQEAELRELQAQLTSTQAIVEGQRQELASKGRSLARLEKKNSTITLDLERQAGGLEAREARLAQLEEKLTEREREVARVLEEFGARDERLRDSETTAAERETRVAELEAALADRDRKLAPLETALRRREERLEAHAATPLPEPVPDEPAVGFAHAGFDIPAALSAGLVQEQLISTPTQPEGLQEPGQGDTQVTAELLEPAMAAHEPNGADVAPPVRHATRRRVTKKPAE